MSAAVEGPRDRDEGGPSGEGAGPDFGRGGPRAVPKPDLRAALRTARIEDAERSRAIADLHGAELARLELLKDRIAPVLAQVPAGIDLFDAGIMPGLRPRLFIDMVGFVEMAHDRRRYRFVQDTREGRIILCDSDRIEVVCEAVTAYVARRLIEREKALASSLPATIAADALPVWPGLRRAARLGLEYLGLAALVVLIWVLGHALYQWAVVTPR